MTKVIVETTYLLGKARGGGVRTYIDSILKEMACDTNVTVHCFDRSVVFGSEENRFILRLLYKTLPGILMRLMRTEIGDVVWCPVSTVYIPRGKAAKKVVTIHDMAPYVIPEAFELARRLRWKWYLHKNLKDATDVIVPTEAVKQDLLRFKRFKARIYVVPHGLNYSEFHFEVVRNKQLLILGELGRKKDTLTVLKAIKSMQGFKLVVVGRMGNLELEGKKLLYNLINEGVVEYHEHLSWRDLKNRYKGSEFLIVSSAYEGFGIPILEGLASGCKVVATDIPAFREVGGDRIRYYQSGDESSLKYAILSYDNSLLESSTEKGTTNTWLLSALTHMKIFCNDTRLNNMHR